MVMTAITPFDSLVRLTYSRQITGVPVIGFDIPESEADQSLASRLRLFFRPFAWQRPLWAGRAGSRKARRPSDRYVNPYGSVHPFDIGCGFNRNQRVTP